MGSSSPGPLSSFSSLLSSASCRPPSCRRCWPRSRGLSSPSCIICSLQRWLHPREWGATWRGAAIEANINICLDAGPTRLFVYRCQKARGSEPCLLSFSKCALTRTPRALVVLFAPINIKPGRPSGGRETIGWANTSVGNDYVVIRRGLQTAHPRCHCACSSHHRV